MFFSFFFVHLFVVATVVSRIDFFIPFRDKNFWYFGQKSRKGRIAAWAEIYSIRTKVNKYVQRWAFEHRQIVDGCRFVACHATKPVSGADPKIIRIFFGFSYRFVRCFRTDTKYLTIDVTKEENEREGNIF